MACETCGATGPRATILPGTGLIEEGPTNEAKAGWNARMVAPQTPGQALADRSYSRGSFFRDCDVCHREFWACFDDRTCRVCKGATT